MERLEKVKKIVNIRFEDKEIEILKAICDTNLSVPKVVHENLERFSKGEISGFIKELSNLLEE